MPNTGGPTTKGNIFLKNSDSSPDFDKKLSN